ncbi:hypothetical protein ABW20_dc0108236 [Dactylellina cionopaga]|nr:hypothetical protein ABW20_dc0108236 [Dactylellina cionopaga]
MARLDSEETGNTLDALDLLVISPPSWDLSPSSSQKPALRIIGSPSPWLTSLISSSLKWLPDDAARDLVWETASVRLAERCGRTAMPDLDRTFKVTDEVNIKIHEPSLDGDNLGLKTWGAAYVLAKRLAADEDMKGVVRSCLSGFENKENKEKAKRVLELGSGTGLAGLALAATLSSTVQYYRAQDEVMQVHLTDLPPILPNLQRNVDLNKHLIPSSVNLTTGVLDWCVHTSAEGSSLPPSEERVNRYQLIVAADPLYSSEHPDLLSTVVSGWLQKSKEARFILELPLRKLFDGVITDFRNLMDVKGFIVVQDGGEDARDDWGDGGESMRCWWVVYAWSTAALCE